MSKGFCVVSVILIVFVSVSACSTDDALGPSDSGIYWGDNSGAGDGDADADGDGDADADSDADADGDPVMSAGCGGTPSLKSGTGLSINGRTYNLKVPDDYDSNKPYRLIMSYHWLGGSANDVSNGGMAQSYYGLWDLAQGSTIFVAPQGEGNAWNNSGGADVEFSRELISLMEDEFCIDKSRIFCEGFSMGGSMSYAMACAMGDVIRGVAVHSGGPMSGCQKPHDKPVAYFMTHGTNDSVCTYSSFGVPILADFAETNGCTTTTDSLPNPSGNSPSCLDFEGCQEGYPTRACIFVGDHTPSPSGNWVPGETWDFISQF